MTSADVDCSTCCDVCALCNFLHTWSFSTARARVYTALLLLPGVAIFAELDSPLRVYTSLPPLSLELCFENQFEGLFMSRRSAKSLALINQVKGTCPLEK